MKIQFDELLAKTRALFEMAGLCTEHAVVAAEAICTASLRGTDSHGIRLLPHYLEAINTGRIDPKKRFEFTQTSSGTGRLNANHGMAHAAVAEAMDHAIGLAERAGVGFVAVTCSNHCGAMAYYALRACSRDMIGFAFTNATAKLKTFNASIPFFGINPICMAAPMLNETPFCYDAAPSIMPSNRIKMLKEKGELLPPDVAADEAGDMTNEPSMARMLLPLGGKIAGYKGYGMAMLVDVLCSLLTGMPAGRDVSTMYPADGGVIGEKRYLGQFVGAIKIGSFEDPLNFKRRLQEIADAVRAMPADADAKTPVMIPGDPEKRKAEKRILKGIPIPENMHGLFS